MPGCEIMRKLFFQLLVIAALLLCNEVFAGGTLYVYVLGPNGKYFNGFHVKIYEGGGRYCTFEGEGENRSGKGIPHAIIGKLESSHKYHIRVCKRVENGYLQKSFDLHFKGPQAIVTLKINEFEFCPNCGPDDLAWMVKGNEIGTQAREL
jgi:hypothetical protein